MKKYSLFIGVDISKKWIDVALTVDGIKSQMVHRQFDNNQKGFKNLIAWINKDVKQKQFAALKNNWICCMEHTGLYSLPLCRFLEQEQIDYKLESALRIKRSLGIQRGKDDKADSKAIARYVSLHHKTLKISKLPTQALLDLKDLLAYRARLLKQLNALKVAAREGRKFASKESISQWVYEDSKEIIQQLQNKMKMIKTKLVQMINENEAIKNIFDLVTSVKGIGLIIGLQMIIHTNCFEAFDSAKKFACYIGIAPFHHQSGISINKEAKISRLGHKKLKALFSNGVASAIQHDKELKAYYERKLAQGKNKFKVLNAVKNKLVHRIFATVKRGTPYVELYKF